MSKVEAITVDEFRRLGPKPARRKQTPEGAVLSQVRDFLRLHGWKVVRIHQSLGSEKGIPDLCAIREGQTCWIDVKAPKGRLSEHQEAWLQDLEDHGGWYIVARSVEDVEHLAERLPSAVQDIDRIAGIAPDITGGRCLQEHMDRLRGR